MPRKLLQTTLATWRKLHQKLQPEARNLQPEKLYLGYGLVSRGASPWSSGWGRRLELWVREPEKITFGNFSATLWEGFYVGVQGFIK